jgi:hypothetical protein
MPSRAKYLLPSGARARFYAAEVPAASLAERNSMTEPDIARRVTELEGEVGGEKVVTRHILEQLRANTDILLELRKEMTGLHQKLDRLGDRAAITEAKVTALETKSPGIVGDAMRETYKGLIRA